MKPPVKLGLFLASSSMLVLAGCTAAGDADFSHAEPLHLARAVSAAAGADAAEAMLIASGYASLPQSSACPKIDRIGSHVTVTGGGCSNGSGTRYDGSAAFDNVPGFGQGGAYDPNQATSIAFDHFSMTDSNGAFVLDGSVTSKAGRMDVQLSVTAGGLLAHTAASYSVAAGGQTQIADGSQLDVDGLGTADISGTYTFGDGTTAQPAAGTITLQGKQRLDILVGNKDANGCLPYTIDGKAAGLALCSSGN